MTDIADTAAESFDAVSAVIHQWYELSGSEGPNRERHSDNRRAQIRVHPAYERTLGIMAGDVSKRAQ